jgi:uncharacterized C2H2 Zn-finger protein
MGMLLLKYFTKEVEQEVEEEVVEQEEFVCPHCDKVYKTEKGLLAHIESKHREGDE